MLEHARLVVEINAAENPDEEDGTDDYPPSPSEIRELKAERTRVKRALKSVDGALLIAAHHALQEMHANDAPGEAVGVLRSRIEQMIGNHVAIIEQEALAWYNNLVGKYGTTLGELEVERDMAAVRLDRHLKRLGYEVSSATSRPLANWQS